MNTDDQIKLAQAQLVQHTAEQLGVDVNELSTEELAKFAAHVLAGEGMADVDPEVQEKVAEADALGRIMARSFLEEQQNMSFGDDVQEKVAGALEDISDLWAMKIAQEELAGEEMDEEDEEDEGDEEDETVAKTAMWHLADELNELGEHGAALKVAAASKEMYPVDFVQDYDAGTLKRIGLAGGRGTKPTLLSKIPGMQNLSAGYALLGRGKSQVAKDAVTMHKGIKATAESLSKAEKALAAATELHGAKSPEAIAAKANVKALKDVVSKNTATAKAVSRGATRHLLAGGGKLLGTAGGLGLAGYGAYRALGGGEKTAAAAKNPYADVRFIEDYDNAALKRIGLAGGRGTKPTLLSKIPGVRNLSTGYAYLGHGKSQVGREAAAMQKTIQANAEALSKAEKAVAAATELHGAKSTQAVAAKAHLKGIKDVVTKGDALAKNVRSGAMKHLAAGAGKLLGTAGGVGLLGYGAYKALGGGENEYKMAGYEFAKLAEERAAEIMFANGIDPQTFESVYPTEVKIAHVVTPDDVWTYEEKIAAAEFNEQLNEAAMHILESIGLA